MTYSASAMKTMRSPSVLALVRQPQQTELAVAEDTSHVVHDVGPMDVDELFDAWERAWSGRDEQAFEPLCDPDVHYEDPLTPEPIEGHQAIAAHAQRLWTRVPRRAHADAPASARPPGPTSPPRCKVLATHRPRGRGSRRDQPLRDRARRPLRELREERLLRIRAFFDLYGAAVQLGVLPRPGTMGEKALLMLRGFGLRS